MQPSIGEAQPIILDGETTPGCLPPARGAARRTLHLSGQPLCPRAWRRTVRYSLMRQTDPDGYRSLQMGFFPFGWSCETVEPARDACLGPVMSPDVTFPERLFPTCPRGRRSGRYSLMSRDGPDGTNHCRRVFHPLSWSC